MEIAPEIAVLLRNLDEAYSASAWHGPNNQRSRKPGVPGEVQLDFGAIDLKKGGSAIPYHEEDPAIRAEFAETLKKHGVENRMLPEFYTGDAGDAVGNVM